MRSSKRNKGAYCLLIKVLKDSKIKIGKLGRIEFKKGCYIYVGSALNSLDKRIQRHLKREKKKFWHIDYLLSSKSAKIDKVYVKMSNRKEECRIAKFIAKKASSIPSFGCADCTCPSHLFLIKKG